MTTDAGCPPEQRIAAFVDGALSAAERAELQQHVDGCPSCFDLIASISAQEQEPLPTVEPHVRNAVLAPRGRVVFSRVLPALSVAAALVLAVIWLRHPAPVGSVAAAPTGSSASEDARTRSGPFDGVRVEQPTDGDIVNGRPEIRWSAPPEAVAFDVVVTSSTGDVLWQRRVPAGSRSARIDVALPSGNACYVWVAALLPENRRLTSNVVKVHTAEP